MKLSFVNNFYGILFLFGCCLSRGTTSLIGFFDVAVASGRMEVPYLNPTRTEEDFVKAVEALVSTNPETS